ncbi:hypothetical protein [Mesorhizobium sp. A556]
MKNIEENDLIRVTRKDGQIATYRVTHMAIAQPKGPLHRVQ